MSVVVEAMSSAPPLVRSGIPPLDARLGGMVAGRIHVLSGGPGTGKSTACLQLVREGLRRGETVAMLTADRATDLRSHAAYVSLDLAPPLHDGRLILLRYRRGFGTLLQHAASPEQVLDDLRRTMLSAGAARLVVDGAAPFLQAGPIAEHVVEALAELLEDTEAAALVTYMGDLTGARGVGYDHRLEPLVERAAAVLHLTRSTDVRSTSPEPLEPAAPSYRLDVVRARYPVRSAAPVRCAIEPGVGLTLAPPRRAPAVAGSSRRLLALGLAEPPSEELIALARGVFAVDTRQVAPGAPTPDRVTEDVAAVLVELRHETLDAALALIHDLSRHSHAVPVIGLTRFNVRSSDRARALRAGADEFLAGDMGPAEFVERLEGAVRRGRVPRAPGSPERARSPESLPTQPAESSAASLPGVTRYRPLDREGFAQALAAHVAHDHPTQCTVICLAPGRVGAPAKASEPAASDTVADGTAADESLRDLADVVMRSMRGAGGDLAALVDGHVAVYLHGTRRRDAAPFVERVRERWAAHRKGGALHIQAFSYPSDEPPLRALVDVRAPTPTRDAPSPRAVPVEHR